MKKIAFFVEGETEYYFVSKLLKEIAGEKNINIKADKLTGGGKKQTIRSVTFTLESTINPNAKYEALIRVSGTDNRVDTDILDFHNHLKSTQSLKEYSTIIGLRDLKGQKPDFSPNTIDDLPKLEKLMKVTINNCALKDSVSTNILIVVYEIEAWFLAECTHFKKIGTNITEELIESELQFNPCKDDMTLRPEPARDLHHIYQLAKPPRAYNKNESQRNRTVNSLDYTNLYLTVKPKIEKLNMLINTIDEFLTE